MSLKSLLVRSAGLANEFDPGCSNFMDLEAPSYFLDDSWLIGTVGVSNETFFGLCIVPSDLRGWHRQAIFKRSVANGLLTHRAMFKRCLVSGL